MENSWWFLRKLSIEFVIGSRRSTPGYMTQREENSYSNKYTYTHRHTHTSSSQPYSPQPRMEMIGSFPLFSNGGKDTQVVLQAYNETLSQTHRLHYKRTMRRHPTLNET